ncbi:hypothetical protein T05_10722 [Trichinella murrelli]|uniref:G-protein coupled receptors family 1 profile domain-containing protein n=1 Tax=Trichinella murrelli TaxID=144512 RepID=A0A0V0TPT0_9BILA|nr:hypothetical protein T05_10722 [Trichinella murrelli]
MQPNLVKCIWNLARTCPITPGKAVVVLTLAKLALSMIRVLIKGYILQTVNPVDLRSSALGNAFLGAGFVAYNTRIEVIEITNKTIDQKLCLLRAPDITLFQLGDTLLAVSVFSLAVERCIAVSTITLDQMFIKKTEYFLIRFTILATLLDCAIFWILVLSTSRPKVHYCVHMEIASETLFVMHFIFISVLGYSSLILCIITALLIKKHRSICCNVRQMQLRREMRVMKRIIVALAFTFCFQNVPATLHLIVVYNPDLEFLNSQYLWIAQNISASVHAAMHILLTVSIRNIFSRMLFHFNICSPFKFNSVHAADNKIIIVHSTCGKSEKTICELEKSKHKSEKANCLNDIKLTGLLYLRKRLFIAPRPNMSNKSIIYFSMNAKASAFCISQIVFGFLCIASNLLLFFIILSEKKLRQSQRFIAGSALGSAFLGAGFISFYLRIVLITDLKATLEPKQCLTQSPHITFYVLGDTILAISVFSSSVERLIAVSKTRVCNKLRSKAVSVLQVMIAILSLIDLILCWYCTFYKQQIHVSVICIEREVFPKELYTMHFFCVSLLGFVTVILFLLAAIFLKRNRSTCRGIRQLQLKRETIIMKRILVAVVLTLFFQNIPAMLNLKTVLLNPNVLSLMPDYFWLMQNISCTIYAAVCIVMNNSVKRHLKSICLFSNFSAIMPTQMCTYR